jgi:hypothetical protein
LPRHAKQPLRMRNQIQVSSSSCSVQHTVHKLFIIDDKRLGISYSLVYPLLSYSLVYPQLSYSLVYTQLSYSLVY